MDKTPHIQLKLFASLNALAPSNADHLPIDPGTSVATLLAGLNVPIASVHLIFIDGIKCSLDATLCGGERVGIFPPVAGG
jgi:molybdopterin synthase sulfur carrier subunit